MLTSIFTLATASLLPFAGEVIPATSVSVPPNPPYEKHQSLDRVPMELEFFHRGSGRCDLQNCEA